jgi:hypothetical protein
MDKALESIQNKEAMDPAMMDDEQNREIIRKSSVMHNERPYEFNMNRKKRAVAKRGGLKMMRKR